MKTRAAVLEEFAEPLDQVNDALEAMERQEGIRTGITY